MTTQSLRRRVTTVAIAVLALALIAVAAFVYLSLRTRLDGELQRRLTDRAAIARELAPTLSAQDLADRLSTDGTLVTLRTGSAVINGVPRPAPPPGPRAGGRPPGPRGALAPPGPAVEPSAVIERGDELTLTETLPGGDELELAVSRADERRALSRLLVLELIGSLVALSLATAALWRVLGVALAPLDDMTRMALRIARGRSGERLAPVRTDTELGRLAGAFDEMLDAQEGALGAARRSERRQRRFLADASHELRSPIAGIQATGETLLRDGTDPRQRERLAVALVREARRATRLVGDLLDITRAEEGLDLRMAPVDLSLLARDVVERERRVDGMPILLFHSDDDQCEVSADSDRIVQILAALLDNARRATPGGTIAVEVLTVAGRAEVAVHDDGPGVAPEERERIFERFVRLDASRSRDSGGSGLGLAIARGIAEAHHGTLTCTDSPRGGAAFTLSLPGVAVPARGAPEVAQTKESAQRTASR